MASCGLLPYVPVLMASPSALAHLCCHCHGSSVAAPPSLFPYKGIWVTAAHPRTQTLTRTTAKPCCLVKQHVPGLGDGDEGDFCLPHSEPHHLPLELGR